MFFNFEKELESYRGTYRKGNLFGKRCPIELDIYPSHIEGKAFGYIDDELGNESSSFNIPYENLKKIYVMKINTDANIAIEYTGSIVKSSVTIVLAGIQEPQKWIQIIETAKEQYLDKLRKKRQFEIDAQEEQRQMELQREENALRFYQECYAFHIKENTPVYQIFAEKNKVALIYIAEDKSLNFLKIDGYEEEENIGVIAYDHMHYYEKAGNIHYTTSIQGNYSSFGGSVTGGNFSKLAAVGGGLLFGFMGMAIGTALTYKPAEQKPVNTSFSIDSNIESIDDRNVILNFYSDNKKQYVDIELPYEIYNFLQTHLPEKKYGIVDELEKRAAVSRSMGIMENNTLGNIPMQNNVQEIETNNQNSDVLFIQKVEKLKIMKNAGLLSDEEFECERKKLLSMI